VLADHRCLEEADVLDDRLVHVDGDVVLGLETLQVVADLGEHRDGTGVLLRHRRGVAREGAVDAPAERRLGPETDRLAGRAVLGTGQGGVLRRLLGEPHLVDLGRLCLQLLLHLRDVPQVDDGGAVGGRHLVEGPGGSGRGDRDERDQEGGPGHGISCP
jgi:hypothetical protein